MSSTVTGHCHLRVGTADARTVGGGLPPGESPGALAVPWAGRIPPHSQSSHPEAWLGPSRRFESRPGANPFQTAPHPAFPRCLDSGCPMFLDVPLTALSLHLGVRSEQRPWGVGEGGCRGGGWWSPASGEMMRDCPSGHSTGQDRSMVPGEEGPSLI